MDLPIPESVKPWLNFFHPVLMFVLLGLTVYALYLGIQIRLRRGCESDFRF